MILAMFVLGLATLGSFEDEIEKSFVSRLELCKSYRHVCKLFQKEFDTSEKCKERFRIMAHKPDSFLTAALYYQNQLGFSFVYKPGENSQFQRALVEVLFESPELAKPLVNGILAARTGDGEISAAWRYFWISDSLTDWCFTASEEELEEGSLVHWSDTSQSGSESLIKMFVRWELLGRPVAAPTSPKKILATKIAIYKYWTANRLQLVFDAKQGRLRMAKPEEHVELRPRGTKLEDPMPRSGSIGAILWSGRLTDELDTDSGIVIRPTNVMPERIHWLLPIDKDAQWKKDQALSHPR